MAINTATNTRFVVLTTNRSGSVWVMSTLNQAPSVTAQGELFLGRARSQEPRWDSEFACPRFMESTFPRTTIRPMKVFRYLDQLYSRPGSTGFKLMYAQLKAYPEILMYLARHRVRVVHLVRQNHLDVLLSFAVKERLGRAHLLSGQAAPESMQIRLETRDLLDRLAWLEKKQRMARRLLRSVRLPHIEVSYERLCRDKNEFSRVDDFLSVSRPVGRGTDSVVKIRTGGQQDVISNYDEVRETLADSRFASLLE